MLRIVLYSLLTALLSSSRCNQKISVPAVITVSPKTGFTWDNATIYFLLTDRFFNAAPENDFLHPVTPAAYRGFMGGDVKGITAKLKDGYFDSLGVDAIWMTPLFENISEGVDEGSGYSYGYHGYWIRDWTAFDRRVGTKTDIHEMVDEARSRGIRIIFDVVINHTGPVTPADTQWPDEWVRTAPECTYKNYNTTIECTLVKNLPDIKTESTDEVELPAFLIDKWKKEGRYEPEVASLNAFFERTGYPRRPYYYIVKWLTDMIREFGIDGFRVDTVKHTEEGVWETLWNEAVQAFDDWKKANPGQLPDEQEFYMLGEVYGYNAANGRIYDFGDKKVDYFNYGFSSLINFGFKYEAQKDYEHIFKNYDSLIHGPLQRKSTIHYLSSHDDGAPFDPNRQKSYDAAIKLLLSPGVAQIYYGDETARSLNIRAAGDAKLRSFMNWDQLNHPDTLAILQHWQKIGQFRRSHPSVGAGRHQKIQDIPYTFSRSYIDDKVVVSVNTPKGKKSIPVNNVFPDGALVRDAYSGMTAKVNGGTVDLDTAFDLVLLEKL
jgi:alpha-amylase